MTDPIDTTDCDREPIHIPGSIQPHGVLLAVDPDSLEILQAAATWRRCWAGRHTRCCGTRWRTRGIAIAPRACAFRA
jgi:light-regulated signal transduction histidine kinase (bacteriophytochrome)